jgi:hypothetical protein
MIQLLLLICVPLQEPAQSATPADKAALQKDLLSFPKPKPVPAPDPRALDNAIRRGLEFLIREQNEEGTFGSAGNTRERSRAKHWSAPKNGCWITCPR